MLGPPAAASYKHALLLSQSHQPATRLATYQPLMQRSHAASYLSPGSRNCGLLGIGCLVQMCTALPPPRRCCCNRSLHMPAPMAWSSCSALSCIRASCSTTAPNLPINLIYASVQASKDQCWKEPTSSALVLGDLAVLHVPS